MALVLPVACGDDETTPTPNKGGSDAGGEAGSGTTGGNPTDAGAGGVATMLPPGISDTSKTEMCGGDSCKSAAVGPVFIDPCCADDSCGLSTGFLALVGANFADECQPKGQVGEVDEACPTSAPSAVPFNGAMLPINGFVGCCRENGKCGVVVDDVTSPALGTAPVANLGLGCVDAAPFFPGKTPAACGGSSGGAGSGGAGGADGLGGAGGELLGGAGGAGGAGGNN